ncbi:MgtC/SapB family protein [Aridibaculum aurantiacum]|uniref:MgtC/SapB family protein n=1 Tax=Aridibaculum aurantiacum TaxID=2810307 RepID=UPI001A968AE1|nr:MgtC/SapB family protein [Aridibaculum aurantiacum]
MDEQSMDLTAPTANHLIQLSICIGIGFLIGLERTFSKQVQEGEEEFAGLRTFTLVAVFGYISAFLSAQLGTWLYAVAFASMVALVIVSYFKTSTTTHNMGGTSEVATILTFLLGALVFLNHVLLALIITVITLLLLAYKPTLHVFVKKLSREELLAIIKFVIMSALVIPFLPDTNFGPYSVWNLKDIWKMVILVSGTSLVGYLIAKVIGNKGTVVAGVVGGLVSSTAVTLTFSRRSKQASEQAAFYFALAIICACTIMFARILFEVYVVNRQLAAELWIPMTILTATGFGAAFLIFRGKKGKQEAESVPLSNPLNLGTAIKFALFFAGIMLLVKYTSENFGNSGTYIAGAISGITDVDAITLSMAKMAKGGDNNQIAINTILIAALSNSLVKFGIVMIVGSKPLVKIAAIGFISIFVVGGAYFLINLFLL